MTISSTTNRVAYTGNGSVDTYSYTFRVFANTDLLVTVKDTDDVETTLVLTTDYTVTGVGDSGGGTVVLVDNNQDWIDADGDLVTGYEIVIRRVRPLTQETEIRNQGEFFPETHEDAFDHLVMIDQQQQDEIDRSIKLPESIAGSTFDMELPADGLAASTVIMVNATGDGFTAGPTASEISGASSSASAAAASAAAASASASSASSSASSATSSASAAAASAALITPYLGTGAISQTTFTIANNTAVAADVTGCLLSSSTSKAAKVHGAIRRKTDTASSELIALVELLLIYSNQDSVWYLVSVREDSNSSPSGVTFTVTSGGQVQYTSSNISGSNYIGEFKFKAETFNV